MNVAFVREVLGKGPEYARTLAASEDLCRMVQCNIIPQDWVSDQTLFHCALLGYTGNFSCHRDPPAFCAPYCREVAAARAEDGGSAESLPAAGRQPDTVQMAPVSQDLPSNIVSPDRPENWQSERCEWMLPQYVAQIEVYPCPSLWWLWVAVGLGLLYIVWRRS